MKQSKLFFTLLLFLVSGTSLFSQEYQGQGAEVVDTTPPPAKKVNKVLKNGFSIKFNFGFPSSQFLNVSIDDQDIDSNLDFNTTLGFQIGNQWYVYRSEKFGIALNVNWLDISFGEAEEILVGSSTTEKIYFIDLSLLEFGPLVSYALNDDMGIDAFYNLKPNTIWFGNDTNTEAAFGITSSIGTAFRYKVFYVGLESNFGTATVQDLDVDNVKVKTNQTRLSLGFKF